jgi:DNA helicase IV
VHAAEVAREQAVLDRARARLDQLRVAEEAAERTTLRERVSSPQAVYERDVAALAHGLRRAELDAAGHGLLFGRLDLARPDDGGREVLHIGRLGLRTPEQEPIVIDWRAPAAAAFYRATPADPQAVIRRRVITCRDETVVGVEDELLDPAHVDALEGGVVVGDGAFLAAVSRTRGPRMRDIIATIQREQDEAVRAPDDGAVIVTGGPGTGKTAVALHRVAYLMYARRERYSRRGVLVVGPSGVFITYISAVLPSLGETSVRLSALGDLVPGVRARTIDPAAVAAVKGSVRMATVLARAARRAATPPVPQVTLVLDRARITLGREDAQRLRARWSRARRPHNENRAAATDALIDLVWTRWARDRGADDWAPQTRRDARADLAEDLAQEAGFAAFLDAVCPRLDPSSLLAELRTDREVLGHAARGVLDDAEVALLAAAWAAEPAVLTAADAALLDELAAAVGPVVPGDESEDDDDIPVSLPEEPGFGEVTTFADRTARTRRDLTAEEAYADYAHVVVDEAQDVSPMQWRMLARRGRTATWTIVGDWAQSAWPDLGQARAGLAAVIEDRRVREHHLSTNYRTSAEIAALAAALLARIDPDATAPAAVRVTGNEPRFLLGVGDLAAAVRSATHDVVAQVAGTVGVIAPLQITDAVRGWLAGVAGVAGVSDVADLDGTGRVTVMDPISAKGLEFDAAVVVAPEDIIGESPTGLRTVYVALTRATQRLTVVSTSADPLGGGVGVGVGVGIGVGAVASPPATSPP